MGGMPRPAMGGYPGGPPMQQPMGGFMPPGGGPSPYPYQQPGGVPMPAGPPMGAYPMGGAPAGGAYDDSQDFNQYGGGPPQPPFYRPS